MKQVMKICFLANTLNIDSGWGRYAWEVIHRLAKEKNIEVIVLAEEISDYPGARMVLRHSFKGLFFVFLNAFKVRKYIKQADIIHCLDAYPYGLIGALANLGFNKKLIINGVGTYSVAPLEQPIKGWLLRWAYQKADAVPCISSFTEKQILKRVKLKNTQVNNLGIDFDKFQTAKPLKRFNKTEKIILGVGALKKRKGYHISIPAVAEVKKKYPQLKYYIVGLQEDQVYFAELKSLVAKYQLENEVIFLANLDDQELIKLYHQTDLFLLTSVNVGLHFEGFGLVFLEANACKKPVVGTYHCGAEDIIKDNYNGFLVPQNDVQATAQAVLKILDNPSLAQKLSVNAQERAKEMSWDKTIQRYLKIYQKTLGS